jgi:hypothetical protein
MRAPLLVAVAVAFSAACASAGAPGTSGDDTGGGGGGPVDARVDVPVDACPDMDNDGACNGVDRCPGFDDRTDSDADTVADGCDKCPGQDDRIDTNMNMTPDACETMTRTIELKQVGTNYWRGWYASNTMHASSNDNTLTGEFVVTTNGVYNSYYVFSLAGLTAFAITDVKLELQFEAWAATDATETFTIWDVTTPAATVENGITSPATHSDLMTGTSYGTQTVTAAQLTTVVSVPLNAAAATAVKAQLGNDFVVGMHLDTPPGWVRFGNTGANTIRLVVTYLP